MGSTKPAVKSTKPAGKVQKATARVRKAGREIHKAIEEFTKSLRAFLKAAVEFHKAGGQGPQTHCENRPGGHKAIEMVRIASGESPESREAESTKPLRECTETAGGA